MRVGTFLGVGLTSFLNVAIAAGENVIEDWASKLHVDPFERPKLLEERLNVSEPSLEEVIVEPLELEGELRAIAVAGEVSMANVDGIILMIGQEIQGFTLVEVRERSAIFEKDGIKQTLTMN